LTPALDGGEWSASRPGRFTRRERAPVTHWIGCWVGPKLNQNQNAWVIFGVQSTKSSFLQVGPLIGAVNCRKTDRQTDIIKQTATFATCVQTRREIRTEYIHVYKMENAFVVSSV
jgi:hypothetical protein